MRVLYRVAFVKQPELAVWHARVVGVEEDATVHEGAVEIGDERSDVPEK